MAVTQYTWDPLTDSVLEEKPDGAGKVRVTYTNEPTQWGPLLSEERGGQAAQYHFDALGSTTFLTNAAGTVTDTFTYDAWGNPAARTGTTPIPYTWVGRWGYWGDGTTSGYYVRARNYRPRVARWATLDPLWTPRQSNGFLYASSSSTRYIDPSGLKCIVCGGAWSIFEVPIANLDAFYRGTPFQDAADAHVSFVNKDMAGSGLSFPIPIKNTGLFAVSQKTRPEAALHKLFFIVFDICETPDPPGTCRLFLDETGSITTWVRGDQIRINGGRNEGDVTGTNTSIGLMLSPVGTCPKSLIFTDFPGAMFSLTFDSMTKKLRQKIEVRDSGTGGVVASTTNDIDFSVDTTPTFTPEYDEAWTVK